MTICGNCPGGNPGGQGGGGPNNERLILEVLQNIDRSLSALCRLLEDRAVPVSVEGQTISPLSGRAALF